MKRMRAGITHPMASGRTSAKSDPGITADASHPREVGGHITDWVFYLLLAVLALPVALFDIFPSHDGGAHVGNAAIYVDIGESVLDTHFRVQWWPVFPNILGDLVLGTLMLFLPPFVAERLFVFALLVGLPLGVRWCLIQLDRRSAWASLLSVPLGASFLLYTGLYSFLFGVVASLFALGLWIGRVRRHEITPKAVAALALVMMAIYLSHPMPLLALIVWMSAVSFDHWRTHRGNPEEANSIGLRNSAGILLASAPWLALLASYSMSQNSTVEYTRSFLRRVLLLPADALVSFSDWEIPLAILLSSAIAAGVGFGLWRSRDMTTPVSGFMLSTLLLALAYFSSPDRIGPGWVILPRIALLLLITAVLWLATLSLPQWVPRLLMATAVVVTVGLTIVRLPMQADVHRKIVEYSSGIPIVEPESTVLSIWGVTHEDREESRVFQPRRTWSGYLMPHSGSVDLSHRPGHDAAFPLEFQPEYDIRNFTGPGLGDVVLGDEQLVDGPRYNADSQGHIGYVFLWQGDVDVDNDTQLRQWLESDYELVFVSAPHGRLEVFQSKE